jgi:hypothetical protein
MLIFIPDEEIKPYLEKIYYRCAIFRGIYYHLLDWHLNRNPDQLTYDQLSTFYELCKGTRFRKGKELAKTLFTLYFCDKCNKRSQKCICICLKCKENTMRCLCWIGDISMPIIMHDLSPDGFI